MAVVWLWVILYLTLQYIPNSPIAESVPPLFQVSPAV